MEPGGGFMPHQLEMGRSALCIFPGSDRQVCTGPNMWTESLFRVSTRRGLSSASGRVGFSSS